MLGQISGLAVDHVAAISDGYGFDVAVTGESDTAHFEVKSTTRLGRLSFFLSRHEFEVMMRDRDWFLVVLLLSEGREIEAMGLVDRDWIRSAVPSDSGSGGRWASVRLDPPPTAVVPGLAGQSPWLDAFIPGTHGLREGIFGRARPICL